MSKIRQALQLLAGDAGLSMRQVAAALGVRKTPISEIALYARDAGVDWPLASTLSDDELQARPYPPPRPRSTTRAEPDFAALHQELKQPGGTPQLLWEVAAASCIELSDNYRERLTNRHRRVWPISVQCRVPDASVWVPRALRAGGQRGPAATVAQ